MTDQYLSFGFYFSFTYDLSKPLHLQSDQYYDSSHFLWNSNIIKLLSMRGASEKWMDKIVQGFFGSFKIPNSNLVFCMISRRSSEMGGTRFNARGINEDGYVANYVESEQFIFKGQQISSFIQIRGSVPLFWRQTSVTAPPEMVKSLDFAQPYYKKHMQRIESLHGRVSCVNLMSATKSGESSLSLDFEKIVHLNQNPNISYEHIDFHGLTDNTNFTAINTYLEKYKRFIEDQGCHLFVFDIDHSGRMMNVRIKGDQEGVIRTNCVDCLDRTNAFQTKLSFLAIKNMLEILDSEKVLSGVKANQIDETQDSGSFMDFFKNIWADNGDHISKIYTGTGATTSSTTRKGKGGILGLLDHKMKSVGRFFIGNFEDNHKQKAINILLGKNSDSSSMDDHLERELEKIEKEFMTRQRIKIGVLTWCSQIDVNYINQELIGKLTNEMQVESLDILVFGVQDAVKSGGFKMFSSDIKDVMAKYESEFSRFFKVNDLTLKKYTSSYNLGNQF